MTQTTDTKQVKKSEVNSVHPMDTKSKQTFRIKQIILARLVAEFPLHDIATLGMVVQRMWQDIETDTEAKPKKRIIGV